MLFRTYVGIALMPLDWKCPFKQKKEVDILYNIQVENGRVEIRECRRVVVPADIDTIETHQREEKLGVSLLVRSPL